MQKLGASEKSIGNYIIGKTIGQGTFGKVKLGIHKKTYQKVAIKILEKKKICDVGDVQRVSRQIHILKLIRHQNIIQLYQVTFKQIIETPRTLYLIMEYANGGQLFEYIVKYTRVKQQLACKFYQQLLAGIEYTHQLGVVHRDLKPENLLLDNNQTIKIVDFGLSNTYFHKEELKTACGSPCYAAPEMIAGKSYQPIKTDIWSSGVILYAMLCGYLPFEDPDTSKLYKKILSGNYSFPKYISGSAQDLISRILDIEPKTRISIEEIREHSWFRQVQLSVPPGILVGYENIMVDNEILTQLQNFGYDLGHTRQCIEANKHNSETAAYFLLLKKHINSGGESVAEYSRNREKSLSLNRKVENQIKKLTHNPHPPLLKITQKLEGHLLNEVKIATTDFSEKKSSKQNQVYPGTVFSQPRKRPIFNRPKPLNHIVYRIKPKSYRSQSRSTPQNPLKVPRGRNHLNYSYERSMKISPNASKRYKANKLSM